MKIISSLMISLVVLGCATNNGVEISPQKLPDPFDTLPEYSREIRDEFRYIAKARDLRARSSVTPEQLSQYQKELFAELPNFDQRVTIDMTATADKIARFIATAARYDYIAPKNPPMSPVIVDIRLEDATLYDVLRELNAKVGSLAQIQVHTQPRRTLRIEYPNANG